jgi:carboxyl-terminal processing protease
VRAYSDSDYSYFDERELLFGRVDPGQTKSVPLKLSVSEHELSRTDRVEWQVFDQHGAKLAPGSQTTIDISSEGLPRPQFAFGYQILDDPKLGANVRGNADGALQVGERVRMRVNFKNTGEGKAIDTWVTMRNLVGDAVFLHSGRENVKALAPGEARVVEFDLEVKKPAENGIVKLQLGVADAKIGASLAEKLSFPLAASTVTFAPGSGHVLAATGADLYGSPLKEQSQKVARAEPGSALKVLGVADGWYRVELEGKRFAFAKAADVKPGGSGKSKVNDLMAISPPRIALVGAVTQTDGDRVHISGTATDEEAVRDVYISVYNPARNLFGSSEKVFYQAASDPKTGRLEFAADIPLTPGNNIIEIRARENDDVAATKQMWVLRTSGLKEARAAQGKFTSNGKLSVDTLSK